MRTYYYIIILLCISFLGCGEDPVPKPKGYLSLNYPEARYEMTTSDCAYDFLKNAFAKASYEQDCDAQVYYPSMDGALYLTYRPVQGNIDTLLRDAQKLTYEHVRKADNIIEETFVDRENKVYGMFYDVQGNAASQTQFYVTDSVQHFLTGSIYFNTKPNYDSILPAAAYLKNDIRRLMESVTWKE